MSDLQNEQAQLMRLAIDLFEAATGGPENNDADGLHVSAIRETGTGRILSVHVTPIDMLDDEAVPRYVSVQPESVSNH